MRASTLRILIAALTLCQAVGFMLSTPKNILTSRTCSSRLMAVKEVSSPEEFDAIVNGAGEKLVIVDYSTTWCGPCKIMAPKFDAMSETYKDAIFLKVVGDTSTEASKLMKREGVRAVPAFHFWKSGNRVDSISGADPTKLEGIITDNL